MATLATVTANGASAAIDVSKNITIYPAGNAVLGGATFSIEMCDADTNLEYQQTGLFFRAGYTNAHVLEVTGACKVRVKTSNASATTNAKFIYQ